MIHIKLNNCYQIREDLGENEAHIAMLIKNVIFVRFSIVFYEFF